MRWRWRLFSEQLPDGVYRLGEVPDFCGGAQAVLAWLLGLYAFDRYRKPKKRNLKLVLPAGVDGEEISRIAAGVILGPRSDQHAAQRYGPGRTGGGGAAAGAVRMARNSAASAARRWRAIIR